MYENADLDAAVRAGILEPDAADTFRHFVAQQSGRLPADDEQFRLSAGLFDLFVSVGIVLLLFGMYLAARPMGSPAGFLFVVIAWLLAEYFVQRRKMLLPGFLLLVALVLGGAVGLFAVSLTLPGPHPDAGLVAALAAMTPLRAVVIFSGSAVICFLYWYRFGVPIAYAFAALMLCNLPTCLAYILAPDLAPRAEGMLMLGCGLATFVVAIWWDMTDVYRQTRRADIAFWLHGLAALLIANVSLRMVIGMPVGPGETYQEFEGTLMSLTTTQALSILILYAIFTLISLVIDRRALMMAGLVFAFAAFATLSGAAGGSWPVLFGAIAMALLILSSAIWWGPLRASLLSLLPRTIRSQLPRTELLSPRSRPVA